MRPVVLALDLDRTLTGPDLVPDAAALAAVRRLRAQGHICILATGRPADHLASNPLLTDSFDAFVLEGGAVWGPWTRLQTASNASAAVQAGRALAAAGHAVEVRQASFAAPRTLTPTIRRAHPGLVVHNNADQVDVLPAGHDKGKGLRRVLQDLGLQGHRVVALGDNDNDVPLLQAADVGIAVANATPALRALADRVTVGAGPVGVIEAIDGLLTEDGS